MAAQMLAGRGFAEVYNLKGGMNAWEGVTAAGPAEMGLELVTVGESPAEMALLAYGLEHGLESFYRLAGRKAGDEEVEETFRRLAGIEAAHQDLVYRIYSKLEPVPKPRETLDTGEQGGVMEGGFTTEEFLAANKDRLATAAGVLETAMTIEAQALDLYLRFSDKVGQGETKKVLFDLAQKEKNHLELLGRMLNRKI